MPITIRHRQRFRTTVCYESENYSVVRYEQEHDPASWMFVIDDNISDRAMEFDDDDARGLEDELHRVDAGQLAPAAFESLLATYFDGAARQVH